jgi:hypothetical protein
MLRINGFLNGQFPGFFDAISVGVRRMVNLETHKLQHMAMEGILVLLHFQPQLVFIDVLGRFIYIYI